MDALDLQPATGVHPVAAALTDAHDLACAVVRAWGNNVALAELARSIRLDLRPRWRG